jgi:hypothetical protein
MSEAAGETNAMFCAEGETGCSSSWSILGREIDMGERCAGFEGSHVQWIAGDLVVGQRGWASVCLCARLLVALYRGGSYSQSQPLLLRVCSMRCRGNRRSMILEPHARLAALIISLWRVFSNLLIILIKIVNVVCFSSSTPDWQEVSNWCSYVPTHAFVLANKVLSTNHLYIV